MTDQNDNLKLERPSQHLPLLIKDKVQTLIREGTFSPGTKLPDESRLAQKLGVSRASLREAFRILQEDGIISRTPGVGTFIRTQATVKNPLEANLGVTEVIEFMNLSPGTAEIKRRKARADSFISTKLEISVGSPILILERVRTADGKPVVYLTNIVAESTISDFKVPSRFDGSLFRLIEEKYHHKIEYGIAAISPVIADSKLSKKLLVRKGSALLLIDQINYDPSERPIMYAREYWLSDFFEFKLFRPRRHRD